VSESLHDQHPVGPSLGASWASKLDSETSGKLRQLVVK